MLGLNKEEVLENRKKYGSNKITNKSKNSFFKLLLETLGDPIIKILLIALSIKVLFLFKDFDWFETLGIVISIFVASLISTISEYGSETAFEKLQEESSKITCQVKREGRIIEVSIDDIVVNDLVLLQTGDKVPADGHLIEGTLLVDESSINGETKEIEKTVYKDNKLYRGTVIYSKSGLIKIDKVGNNTFYGQMAKDLQEKNPDSPMKIRLRKLAKTISRIGYIGAFFVSFSYLFSNIVIKNNFIIEDIIKTITNIPLLISYILYALTLSVTIIIVSVPEGLPMMITLVLSSNMKRMLKNNVLVRKMVGIETAGSLNILFTDKTGTLTKGNLEVIGLIDGELNDYVNKNELTIHKNYYKHLKNNCLYNNNSNISPNNKIIGGNLTDRAILSFINESKNTEYNISNIEEFNSTNKFSSIILNNETKYLKGAPEVLLPKCKYYLSKNGYKRTLIKEKIESRIRESTLKGMRAIALAYTENLEKKVKDLVLIGILFLKDEIREEVKQAIKDVKEAGIQIVMITGDSKETAINIAKEVGLIESNNDLVITSEELNNISDEEVKRIIPNLKVVSRALPQDKSRLVKITEDMGLVTGMTGDGVNDAPAVKKADVGFSMGSGTEVCKEASDIVILDNNFLSISKAILYGRTIFESIRKFIIFQLTINICAIVLSIIGPFTNIQTPVTVIQMLWINMIMDTLAAIAFSYEMPISEYMKEKPKKKDEPIINKYMFNQILFTGLFSSLICLIFLTNPIFKNIYRPDPNNKYFMTGFFALFIFMGIFNSFNARTKRINLLANINKNKVFLFVILLITLVQLYLIYYGGELFRAFGLTIKELEITILIAFSVVPIDLLRKIIIKKIPSIE